MLRNTSKPMASEFAGDDIFVLHLRIFYLTFLIG